MTTVSLLQHLHAAGAVGVFWLYLLFNLSLGALLPYRRGVRPFLFRLSSAIGRRAARGRRPVLAVVLAAVVAIVAGVSIGALGAGSIAGWVVAIAFLGLTVSAAGPFRLIRLVAGQLRAQQVALAAETLAPYIGEAIPAGDAHAVARKGVEFIALSLCRFLVAPFFWFWLFGATGVLLYVVYAGMVPAVSLSPRRQRWVQGADRVMNLVPSVIAAVLLCLSAFLVRATRGFQACRMVATQGRQAGAGGAGVLLAAMAGALGVTLSRPDPAGGIVWVGPASATARVTVDTLSRALVLQYVVILWLVVAGAAVVGASI